jgi:hypothetical protein
MKVPEKFRITTGRLASTSAFGNSGAFDVRLKKGQLFSVIASDGGMPGELAWEHVSVSRKDRCPTWQEMCEIKDLFWDDDEWVTQFHPARSDYINNHPYCLHLWRPVGIEMPHPHSMLVGV